MHESTEAQRTNSRKALRRYLVLTGTLMGARYTLKAFRAGRATDLAKRGATWQTILSAGEWKGLSPTHYLDTDVVDEAAYLQAEIVASEDEDCGMRRSANNV